MKISARTASLAIVLLFMLRCCYACAQNTAVPLDVAEPSMRPESETPCSEDSVLDPSHQGRSESRRFASAFPIASTIIVLSFCPLCALTICCSGAPSESYNGEHLPGIIAYYGGGGNGFEGCGSDYRGGDTCAGGGGFGECGDSADGGGFR